MISVTLLLTNVEKKIVYAFESSSQWRRWRRIKTTTTIPNERFTQRSNELNMGAWKRREKCKTVVLSWFEQISCMERRVAVVVAVDYFFFLSLSLTLLLFSSIWLYCSFCWRFFSIHKKIFFTFFFLLMHFYEVRSTATTTTNLLLKTNDTRFDLRWGAKTKKSKK